MPVYSTGPELPGDWSWWPERVSNLRNLKPGDITLNKTSRAPHYPQVEAKHLSVTNKALWALAQSCQPSTSPSPILGHPESPALPPIHPEFLPASGPLHKLSPSLRMLAPTLSMWQLMPPRPLGLSSIVLCSGQAPHSSVHIMGDDHLVSPTRDCKLHQE